jgi:hypothetical protein
MYAVKESQFSICLTHGVVSNTRNDTVSKEGVQEREGCSTAGKVFRVIPTKSIEKQKVFRGIGRKTIRSADSAYRFWLRPLLRGFDIP